MSSDSRDLLKIEEKLVQERASLLERIRESKSDQDVSNPDRSDLAQAYSSEERRTSLEEQAAEKLNQVEDALDRLAEGTYGRCRRCGENISIGRLEALPHAQLCIQCKESLEQ